MAALKAARELKPVLQPDVRVSPSSFKFQSSYSETLDEQRTDLGFPEEVRPASSSATLTTCQTRPRHAHFHTIRAFASRCACARFTRGSQCKTPQQFYEWFVLVDCSVAHIQEAQLCVSEHLDTCDKLFSRIDQVDAEVAGTMDAWKSVKESGNGLWDASQKLLDGRVSPWTSGDRIWAGRLTPRRARTLRPCPPRRDGSIAIRVPCYVL